MTNLSKPEPPPTKNNSTPVWELVIADMRERDDSGHRKYGTRLQPHNGRDALIDAYQEALDLVVYLRQAIAERETTCSICHCKPNEYPDDYRGPMCECPCHHAGDGNECDPNT